MRPEPISHPKEGIVGTGVTPPSPSLESAGRALLGDRRSWVWAVLLLSIVGLFWASVASMVEVWARSATYGHGFLILPITVYLAWDRRAGLSEVVARGSWLGLAWLAGAVGLWLLGTVVQANLLQHLAVVAMLQGTVLTVYGPGVARVMALPLGYLLFMVPAGDFAVPPLQGLTADYTTALLKATGIPTYRDGWMLYIPGGRFLVAEACAGVRFLIATIALGVLMAGTLVRHWWKRLAIVALSILVPVVANVFRAYGIIFIAYVSDFERAVGVDHLVYGFVFLSFVMGLLIALAMAMRDHPEEADTAAHPADAWWKAGRLSHGLKRTAGIAAAAVVLLVGVRGYGYAMQQSGPGLAVRLEAPSPAGGWARAARLGDWSGAYRRADAQATWHYAPADASASDEPVSVYVAYYADQRPGKELISSRNRLVPSDDYRIMSSGRADEWGAVSIPAPAYHIVAHGREQRVVWYWYWVGRTLTADPAMAKLADLRHTLTLARPGSGVLALSYPAETADPDRLQSLLARLNLRPLLAEGATPARLVVRAPVRPKDEES